MADADFLSFFRGIHENRSEMEIIMKKLKNVKYTDLFWLFFFGSLIGIVLEGIWCILRLGHWETHSSTVLGPFCIIYGVGMVAMYIAAAFLHGQNLLIRFACYAITGAAVEYAASLFQEICFGTRSWNYNRHFMNIGGRVSLQMAIIWGLLGTAFAYFVFPYLSRLFAAHRGRLNAVICAILTVYMAINLLVTAMALVRWNSRVSGKTASNMVETWLDSRYGDDRLKSQFLNMKFIK